MNILIVGNGFDLSHYLPTKYDHFMDVMGAIEQKDLGKPIKEVFTNTIDDFPQLILKALQIKAATSVQTYQMNFKDLFSKCRDKKIIEKTQEIYDTKRIFLPFEQILEIQYKLKNNSWYQYFSDHVRDVKTWIDFELKIEEVIFSFAQLIPFIEQQNRNSLNFFNINDLEKEVGRKNTHVLQSFHIFERKGQKHGFSKKFCYGNNDSHGMSSTLFLSFAHEQLEEFIKIFDLYLEVVISQLKPNCLFAIDSENWVYPDRIFSFNYTNTFQRIYKSAEIEYLHGRHGEQQNIVLGISDIEDESLKKIKAYGFTKYHQKLFKDTNYLFLDEYISIIDDQLSQFEKHKRTDFDSLPAEQRNLDRIKKLGEFDLNVYIWGHSLDVSDKDYIIDLFSLNDHMDRNVRVTVYYFDKSAKFSLLNNLLAILGKDKVEQWMKNKWLVFKENPKVQFIAQENSDVDQAS